MAAEFPIRQNHLLAPRITSFVSVGGKFDPLKNFLSYFFLRITAVIVFLVTAIAASIVYEFFIDYSRLIDQQLAGGYLKSRAGLYAAPRILEVGSRISRDRLLESLQRSGYAKKPGQ